MDFAFSEQHVAVRETVRRLCQSEHQGLVAAAEENEALPRGVFAIRKATAAAGSTR